MFGPREAVQNWVKGKLPAPVKRAARGLQHQRRLWRPIQTVARVPAGQIPDRQALSDLVRAWNNEGYGADLDYLEEVARRAHETKGPILECGSGVSTIMLGLIAGRRGVETWSLEHSPQWYERVSLALKLSRIHGVRPCYAPIRDFGGFSWYDPSLFTMPDHFSLVICDGPPGDTSGDRYGLMPLFGNRLLSGSVILLDDAHRVGEEQVLRQWAGEREMTVRISRGAEKAFASVTL